MIFTRAFLKGAGERAVKTAAQTLVAVLTAGEVIGILDVDWAGALGAAALAAVLSVLTSVGNADFTAGEQGAVVERPDGTLDVGTLTVTPDDGEHL